jgi:hypothetical protein
MEALHYIKQALEQKVELENEDNSILHALNETSKYIDKFVNTEYQKNNYKKVFEPVLRNYILKSQQKAKELERYKKFVNSIEIDEEFNITIVDETELKKLVGEDDE